MILYRVYIRDTNIRSAKTISQIKCCCLSGRPNANLQMINRSAFPKITYAIYRLQYWQNLIYNQRSLTRVNVDMIWRVLQFLLVAFLYLSSSFLSDTTFKIHVRLYQPRRNWSSVDSNLVRMHWELLSGVVTGNRILSQNYFNITLSAKTDYLQTFDTKSHLGRQ